MMREMQASLQKLPWNELSPTAQAKARSVVSGTPLFHRMPRQTVYADPEIYHFLLRHPDVIIGFWEHLGDTQLALYEVKENHYILKETAGTAATVEVLYRTDEICIVYAKGEYRGPLLAKSYQGDVLLVLRTRFVRDEMNEPMVVCDLDTFIQISSLGADVLAKLFFTSLSKVADSNFEVTTSFVGQVSKAAYRNPEALKNAAGEIGSIRQSVCAEFCEIVDRATIRFARRHQSASTLVQQRPQPVEQARVNYQDFSIFSKPPADWDMNHFVATPLPSYEGLRSDSTGVLNTPKFLDSYPSRHVVPKLPKQTQ